RPHRRADGAALLSRDRLARTAGGCQCPGPLRRDARGGRHRDDRRAGAHQHQRGARPAADQGAAVALRQLRWLVDDRQPGGIGHPAQRLTACLGRSVSEGPASSAARARRVVVAGGGTGGHLYPGIAVARAMQRRDPELKVSFVGTARGLERRVVPAEGFELDLIRSAGVKGKSAGAVARGIGVLPLSAIDAWQVLTRRRPSLVIGVGGYSSGPVVALAALRGTPTLLLEQNAMPGLTN